MTADTYVTFERGYLHVGDNTGSSPKHRRPCGKFAIIWPPNQLPKPLVYSSSVHDETIGLPALMEVP
jgi:hypothetical protein